MIESQRLLLRAFREADRSFLVELLGDESVTALLLSGRPFEPAAAHGFIDAELRGPDEGGLGLGVLALKDTGRPVGFAGLIPCKVEPDELELGFALHSDVQGRGYGTEIGLAQARHALERLGRDRVLALAHPDNEASLAVLRKMGMTRTRQVTVPGRGPRLIFELTASRAES
ncbi:MAG: GNAT family N-acetyltransferase [Acidobacteriota bacterium]